MFMAHLRTHRWELCLTTAEVDARKACEAMACALGIGPRTWLHDWMHRSLEGERLQLMAECKAAGMDPRAVVRSARRQRMGLENKPQAEAGEYERPGPGPVVDLDI